MLFLVVGTPWKRPRSSRPCCPDCDDSWFGGHIFCQNSNVTNATAKFLWERIERVLDYLDEMFTFHPSPTEINKGRLTLSSRRLCRHLLCRRLRLPLRLPRLALVEGGHRQLPTRRV